MMMYLPGAPSRVLLVTAHPDDECMFFTPLICALQRQGAAVCLLCLSTGNADGLGEVRRAELVLACTRLQITPSNCIVIDDPSLQDGMLQCWDAAVVAAHVARAARQFAVDTVVTFDDYGVSGHPNHRAVHRGVLAFLKQHRSQPGALQLHAYVLESVPLLRKYASYLDIPISLVCSTSSQRRVCCVSRRPWLTWQAMKAHGSQLVWFRRLFVVLSRYTFVNTLLII